jgi:hypothetical protein
MLLHGGPYKRVLMAEQGKGLLLGGVLQRNAERITVIGRRKEMRQYGIVEQIGLGKEAEKRVEFVDLDGISQLHK